MRRTFVLLLVALPVVGCNPTSEDPPGYVPTATELADVALGDRAVGSARDAYTAAAEADPTDLQAHAGAAFTRAVLLPEHSVFDDILTACSQPPLDVEGQIFSSQGVLEYAATDQQGTSSITLQRGTSAMTLQPAEFEPDGIYSSYHSGDWGSEIDVWLEDRRVGTNDERIELGMYVEPTDLAWFDGATISIPSPVLDVWLSITADPNSMASYTWIQPVSGSVTVNQAAAAEGDVVELVFSNVRFQRMENDGMTDTVVEVFEVNGTLEDTVMSSWEPAPGSVPFDDLVFQDGPPQKSEFIQVIQACGAGLNVSYLQSKLDELFVEIRAIRAHLDAIADSSDPNGFVWSLPAGALNNRIDVPIGIVEIHALRAMIHAMEGANEVVQQYDFLGSDFVDLIAVLDPYYDWNCSGSCPNVTSRVDLDPALVGADLNLNFLAMKSGSLDMSGAKTSYVAALMAVKDALQASPTANVLFNFQDPVALPGTVEIISFVDLLMAAADAPQTLTDTPEWVLHPSQFFTAPFDRASLLAGTGVAELFDIVGTNTTAGEEDNGYVDIKQAVVEAIVETFIDWPPGPETTTYCRDIADCSGTDTCSGWTDPEGVCYEDMTTPCTWNGNECGSSWCLQDVCDVREPAFFDYDVVDQAYTGEPPSFVDAELWAELEDTF